MPAINEYFTATVRDISSDGNGIVEHPCGQVFFVPGVWIGEKAEFRITGFKKRFGFAQSRRLLAPSPFRIAATCPHQGFGPGKCGGCPWQFIRYEAQLEVKENMVRRGLARLGVDERIKPIWASAKQFGYRNRARLKCDGKNLGFIARDSNQLVPIRDCPILTDHNRNTVQELLATLPNPAFKPAGKELWSTLDIDEQISAQAVAINRRRPFCQANSEQNERMRAWLARSLEGFAADAPLLELFAGAGNFTEVLFEAGFRQILAVEAVAEAIQVLAQKQNPAVNTLVADLFSEAGIKKAVKLMPKVQLLVLDPPRDGFRLLPTLLNDCRKIKVVRYISCDLATFARDLQVLVEQGFQVKEIQPLDQFPHTPHVEILASLSR